MAKKQNLTILQGKTFKDILRWETEPIVRKAIAGFDVSTGCPRLTVTGHGLPNGWRVAVYNVGQPKEINAANNPPLDDDYTPATVIDANTIELNRISAVDWKLYTSGGFVQWNTPHDLAGYTVRMKIKNRVGGTVLASTEAADAPLNVITMAVDNSAKTITRTIDADDTAAFAFKTGVYDVEAVSPSGEVTLLFYGSVTISQEVTT
ncbi:MAG TPA: hypothetical protein PLP42_21475 [Acidobacteriota bacterium]|jgi:hypothetical protein|nr:hypothetical protein [Acidobacteriota bacterium]